jgi:hypothetical protein
MLKNTRISLPTENSPLTVKVQPYQNPSAKAIFILKLEYYRV